MSLRFASRSTASMRDLIAQYGISRATKGRSRFSRESSGEG
jgi:hypothetical protein